MAIQSVYADKRTIYVAGGCFWGVEAYFKRVAGILGTAVGYANGKTENPTYEEVCHNDTGHAETVRLEYDRHIISLEEILLHLLRIIDPYSVNKQGGDVGLSTEPAFIIPMKRIKPVLNAFLRPLIRTVNLP